MCGKVTHKNLIDSSPYSVCEVLLKPTSRALVDLNLKKQIDSMVLNVL